MKRTTAYELKPAGRELGANGRSWPTDAGRVGHILFRFVGCLPLTVRMGGRHRSMRAGVVQTPMEETAECPDAAGTCIAMGIGAVACDVGLMVRSGEAGGCRRDAR